MENNSQIIIYQTEKGETKLEVRLENKKVTIREYKIVQKNDGKENNSIKRKQLYRNTT